MTVNVKSNLSGTTAASFGIGKGGLTIYQGTTNPNTAGLAGVSGDLYVLRGSYPQLWQYNVNTWSVVADSSPARQAFSRTTFTTATYTALMTDYYIGARYSGGSATITLPIGVANKTFIIKDELGVASNNPITVTAASGQTIDGQTSVLIDTAYSSLTLNFGDQWYIT